MDTLLRTTFGALVRQKDAEAAPASPAAGEEGASCGEDCSCAGEGCPCKGECGPDCECGCEVGEGAEPKTYTFRANDGQYDRYNDRLKPEGWKLADYNANPIILYNHDAGTGGWFSPPTKTLPIGKGRAFVGPQGDGTNALFVEIEFDREDAFAAQVESKVSKGILNAVSVRYRMVEGKYRENERHGYDCDEMELLEISVVTIPGNQRALRVKDFAPEDLAEAVRQAEELLGAAKGPGAWVRQEVQTSALAATSLLAARPIVAALQAVEERLKALAVAVALLERPAGGAFVPGAAYDAVRDTVTLGGVTFTRTLFETMRSGVRCEVVSRDPDGLVVFRTIPPPYQSPSLTISDAAKAVADRVAHLLKEPAR